jgi:ABC-type lipoprotein export system ATPase subunit
VGLDHVAESTFRELSGGEAQRLMLARGMATRPDLLLVDEPTAQLDASSSAGVNHALARLSQKATIVVVATHDPGTRDACTDVIDLAGAVSLAALR